MVIELRRPAATSEQSSNFTKQSNAPNSSPQESDASPEFAAVFLNISGRLQRLIKRLRLRSIAFMWLEGAHLEEPNMKKFRILMASVLLFACLDTISAMAQLPDSGDENTFTFGSSCEQLAELSTEELHSVLTNLTEDLSRTFCVPQWPNTCDDYDAFVTGFGRLEDSTSRSYCQFKL